MTPLRLCLVSPKAYDLLVGAENPRHFGGSERQQVLLAHALAARGHSVSVVTLDHGQEDGIVSGGVRVFKAYAEGSGLRGLRFVHPRWTGLVAAMGRADADIYYQMGADSETGQVGAWCRWRRRHFVFSLASDGDSDPALPFLKTARQRALYRLGLRCAGATIAQTDAQRRRLFETFGRASTVIRNCTVDCSFEPAVIQQRIAYPRIQLLWVGRFVQSKRLELLLELAVKRPQWDFHVVGGGENGEPYVRDLERRAVGLHNVTMHRRINDRELHELYLRAHALVCTSSMEGVPTTFLEAWARGVPVVSTVDPDDVIRSHGLGVVTTAGSLEVAVAGLMEDNQATIALHVRQYFLANHSIEGYASAHEELFASLGPPGTRTPLHVPVTVAEKDRSV